MTIRRIISDFVCISLFVILTYAMTAYGFSRGHADFTAGAQIGCVLLGLLFAVFSRVMWYVIVGGYDLLTAAAVRLTGLVERKAERSVTAADGKAFGADVTQSDEAFGLAPVEFCVTENDVTQNDAGPKAPAAECCVTESEYEQENDYERFQYEMAAEERERRELVEIDEEPAVTPESPHPRSA
jgi:hypothetical protein